MFTLEHDRIRFAGKTIADLRSDVPIATLRHMEDEFAGALDEQERRWREGEHDKALKAEYDEGFEAGKEEGAAEVEEKFEAEKAELDAKAFARGYEAAMKDLEHPKDFDRVQAVVQALREVHDALMPLYLGFAAPDGVGRRRNPKISEVKRIASRACADAKMAVNQFEAD